MMTAERILANMQWLEEHSVAYPHHCYTKTKFPDPVRVQSRLPGVDFIRAPVGRWAEWRFRTPEGMTQFKRAYITRDNTG